MPDEGRRPAPGTGALVDAVRGAIARHRLLDPGDHVLVAVSGGPDSVALLHALVLLRSEHRLALTVCHVHHGLRPEADGEQAFVEALADRLGCPVRAVRVVVPRGGGRSPEEAARAARHAALGRVARETGARRIALGHTADDQAETVLMRVLQGAGPRGLAGIPVRRGRLVRPLLEADRGTVEAHLRAHGLTAVVDASNRDPRFLRNRVRHELLPVLAAALGPRVPHALRRLARASREAVEALDALVRPRLDGHLAPTPVGWRLGLSALDGLPAGAVKAAVRLALVELAAPDRLPGGLRAAHLDALAGLVAAAPGARVRLPGGVSVERGRDALWMLEPDAAPSSAALPVPGTARVGAAVVTARVVPAGPGRPADPASEAWFDAEALGLGDAGEGLDGSRLVLRRRRPAERMVPFGGTAPVRLGPLLGAAGVPRGARTRWPVLVRTAPGAPDEVVWLPGIRRGAVAPVTPATRATLQLQAGGGGPAAPPTAGWRDR